jgi:hypothetical protein
MEETELNILELEKAILKKMNYEDKIYSFADLELEELM